MDDIDFDRKIVRQGDVIMIPVKHRATSALDREKSDPRGVVLAEGETSGHHHGVFGPLPARLFRFRDGRLDRLLEVGKGGAEVRVVGGEVNGVPRHYPVSLEEGQYVVRVQQAWDTKNQQSFQVQD